MFIHGFTGHPERTWTHKKGDLTRHAESNGDDDDEHPSIFPKFNPFLKPATPNPVFWPRDILPESAPDARILTYGYDTHIGHWLGPAMSKSTVYDIAWNFLVALEATRRAEPIRPLLFVVHSLGGIVVKEMLRRSSGCHVERSHLRNIFESTEGIIFFGTPHGSAGPCRFIQRVAESVFKAAGFSANNKVVDSLLPSSERLRELREDFGPMACRQGWIIHSFQEQIGVRSLGWRKVVEDVSSCLNLQAVETTEHIGRNHMNMCRFSGPEDVEYVKFTAALDRILRGRGKRPGAESVPPSTELKKQELLIKRQALLESLRFDQIDARQMNIKTAHVDTCRWLLENAEYLKWLDVDRRDDHGGLLWLKGKLGTGKSTLTKFALSNARKMINDRITLSFFFNARGDYLERTTLGLYRSILLQLLETKPTLQDILDSRILSTTNTGYQWSVELLKEVFEHAIQLLSRQSVLCFIDALDECDDTEVRDMVSFFEHMGNTPGIQFHIFFSSRHYPHITAKKGLTIVLEKSKEHDKDIAIYIQNQLRIGQSNLAKEIREQLQHKSSGIFMWVVLVVAILNKEFDDGNMHALRRKLQDIPAKLHDLFREIFTRDSHNSDSFRLCMQWVLFSRYPLRPEELYFAIISSIEPHLATGWDRSEITVDTIQKFILSSSKGLVEITDVTRIGTTARFGPFPTVQFIHESVKDFFLKDEGYRELWPDFEHRFQGLSDEKLKQCCLNQISIAIEKQLRADLSFSALLNLFRDAYPFLNYAISNVLYHAYHAERGSVSHGLI